MSGYIGNIPVPQSTQSRQTTIATAGQTSFATSGYTPGYLDVYLNGIHLVNGTDYTATNSSDVILSTAANLDDEVQVIGYDTFVINEATEALADADTLQGQPASYFTNYTNTQIAAIPAVSFGNLSGKPTTLSGYGITDAEPLDSTILKDADIGVTVQAYNANLVSDANYVGTDENFTSADHSKLDGIEANATADQTGSEIKSSYEAESNTNAFTDAEKLKLASIATGATGASSAADTKTLYESNANTNEFSDAEQTKLSNIEANATADQTKSEIEALNINADTLDGQHGSYYTGYADSAVSNLVASAPSTLNTLNELADALGDDANFATTMTNALAGKVDDSQVLTNVPSGALFTDTTYSVGDGGLTQKNFTTTLKSKLDGITSGATNTQAPAINSNGSVPGLASGISGAEVRSLIGAGTSSSDTTYSAGAGISLSGTTFTIENNLIGDAWYIGRDNNDYFGIETTHFNFVLDGNTDMRLENDGDLHVDGNVVAYSTTTSDERLKKDIVKIDNALDKVSQLSGYTFEYIADGKKSAGVIAQEVEKVMPSAVSETTLPVKMGDDDETEYKTVQYDQLHGLLIEAIKELKAEIELLKGK